LKVRYQISFLQKNVEFLWKIATVSHLSTQETSLNENIHNYLSIFRPPKTSKITLETLDIRNEIVCFFYNQKYFYISNFTLSYSKKQIVWNSRKIYLKCHFKNIERIVSFWSSNSSSFKASKLFNLWYMISTKFQPKQRKKDIWTTEKVVLLFETLKDISNEVLVPMVFYLYKYFYI
jgi:hypothetical protein